MERCVYSRCLSTSLENTLAVGDDGEHLQSEITPLSDKLPDGKGKFYFPSGNSMIFPSIYRILIYIGDLTRFDIQWRI